MTIRGGRFVHVALGVAVSAAAIAVGEPYHVSKSGSSGGTGSSSSPFLTIGQASAVLRGGDTCYIREGTYYAMLVIRNGNALVEIDSRPSDAIALAVRMNVPIFVEEEVLVRAMSAE